MASPSLHVVVPAHNESAVIERCLAALTAEPLGDALRITVVPNGCTDDTAALVRGWQSGDERVALIELPAGGKAAAIRAGVAALSFPPQDLVTAVVDADVVLTLGSLQGLIDALQGRTQPTVCAPQRELDLTGCGWVVRRWHGAWLQEPYVREGVFGAGAYAVNSAGLPVLETLPDLLGDDAWVRASFAPENRLSSAGSSVVRPPRTLRSLIRRRARVLLGNAQLLAHPDRPGYAGRAAAARGPVRPMDRLVFVAVERAARRLARRRARQGQAGMWSADASSRIAEVTR